MSSPLRNTRLSWFGLLSLFCVLLASVEGHSIGHQHGKFHHQVEPTKPESTPVEGGVTSSVQKRFRAIGYYVNWAIYAKNFPPQELQSTALTHVNYAFANVNNQSGEVYLTDLYADVEKVWPGDVPSNKTLNLFGNFKQLYLKKKANRNLKLLLSVGGWSYRHNFVPSLVLATNATENRQNFARSSVEIMKNVGLDGIDIDWEYPTAEDAPYLIDLCRLLRIEMDNYARNLTGRPHFLITLALPAGPDNFPGFDMKGLLPYVDFVNLMGYDYMGSFSNFSGHSQNMFPSVHNPRSTDFSSIVALDYYLGDGLPSDQMVLGMPLYGHSYANTSGPGTNFTPAIDGSLGAAGVWDYKELPLNKSETIHTNEKIIASWSYGEESRYMVSYDTPQMQMLKAKYIDQHGLGGAMWWETSQDLPLNNMNSLIRSVGEVFTECGGYEQSLNNLNYPDSIYANLRAGMPGQ